jgi:hypothetical protein
VTKEEDGEGAEFPEAEGREALIGVAVLIAAAAFALLWPRVAGTVAAWALHHWPVSGFAVLALTGFVIWVIYRQHSPAKVDHGRVTLRVFGIPVRWESTKTSRWKSCRHCTGGMRWLNPRTGWGKIPKEIRLSVEDRVNTHLANVQNCPFCHGAGHHWRRENG